MTDDSASYWHTRATGLAEQLEHERARTRDLERSLSALGSERLWVLPATIAIVLAGMAGLDAPWSERIGAAMVYGSALYAWLMWARVIASRTDRKFRRGR